MKIYKNKNLIISRINDDFYSVVNPFVKNGLRVINKDQHDVLMQIDDGTSLDVLENNTGFDRESLMNFCMMLQEQNILSFSNEFYSVADESTDPINFTLWVHTTNNC